MAKILGAELIFISRILRNGSGTLAVTRDDTKHLDKRVFKCNCLSMTNRTYVACEFNSYVVKLKTKMITQPELDFSIHSHENNLESEAILKYNHHTFSKQCKTVFEALMRGERLTTTGALIKYSIGHLPRRIKDLIDYAKVPVKSELLKTKYKEYFLTEDQIKEYGK